MADELTRLLARGLTPEEESIARRYYSQKERQSMDKGSFCGPHRSFPITSQEDVHNAASLLHHAENPAEVRSCIIAKAKEHGWKLPDSWSEDDKSTAPALTRKDPPPTEANQDDDESGEDDDQDDDDTSKPKDDEKGANPTLVRSTHAAMTGTHSHGHPLYDGSSNEHSHSHSHSNDNDHEHKHTSAQDAKDAKQFYDQKPTEKADAADILRTMPSETSIFAPITRIDRTKREVVVRATAENLDSYQTVIGFEASKNAFTNWRGNIREMHDPTKAVGRSIRWEPNEDEKAIDLVLRVSKGAEDTWQKVLDGTLAGASIGARNGVWAKRDWKGKEVPYLERYDLVEVSLVDNPSCPGCDVKIVRANGMTTEVIEVDEESSEKVERKGARVSGSTKTSMHKARDHAIQGIREMLGTCGCDECQQSLARMDAKDDDGAAGDGSGVMKAVQAEITRSLSPLVARLQAIAAQMASTEPASDMSPEITRRLDTMSQQNPDWTRRLDALEQKLNGLDTIRSVVTEVKDLAERIAAQPQPGGPIMNSAALRGTYPDQQIDQTALEAEVIARLSRSGILNKDQQVNAVMYLQKLQQTGQSARR